MTNNKDFQNFFLKEKSISLYFNDKIELPVNVELVYLDSVESLPDTTGITQLAFIHRSLSINNQTWYEISLLTNENGEILEPIDKIMIRGNKIVSHRRYRSIINNNLYHLSDKITATGFADKNIVEYTLESTSRTALGSGIYGINVPNITYAADLAVDNKLTYEIKITSPFEIQDKEHGESITTASLLTNRYLDKIILSLEN